MDSQQLLDRLERMKDAIPVYAKAKADRVHIEQYRKSLKAILMQKSPETTQAGKESWAYSQSEYTDLLQGLREAVEIEEKHKWALDRVKMEIEVWRTINANERAMRSNV